ncbi:hypothetical protein ACV56Z_13365 [Staphylococcus aureus]
MEASIINTNEMFKNRSIIPINRSFKEIRIAGGREVNLRSLQPLALKAANSIFVGDYLIIGGQPNQLDYDMINDLGFEIDYDTCENKENENDVSRAN